MTDLNQLQKLNWLWANQHTHVDDLEGDITAVREQVERVRQVQVVERRVEVSRLVAANFENLIRNGGFEDAILEPHEVFDAGGEWSVIDTAGIPRSGAWALAHDATEQGAESGNTRLQLNGTELRGKDNHIQCGEGDSFLLTYWFRSASINDANRHRIRAEHFAADGTHLGGSWVVGVGPWVGGWITATDTTYTQASIEVTALAGAAYIVFDIEVEQTGNLEPLQYWDDFECRRMVNNLLVESVSADKITAGTINTGDINVASRLIMNSGGKIKTGPDGSRHIELTSDPANNHSIIYFSTGIVGRNPALIYSIEPSPGVEQLVITSPETSAGGFMRVAFNSNGTIIFDHAGAGGSGDYVQFLDTTIRIVDGSLVDPTIRRNDSQVGLWLDSNGIGFGNGTVEFGRFTDQNEGLLVRAGTDPAFPPLGFLGQAGDGFYIIGNHRIGLAIDAVNAMSWNDDGVSRFMRSPMLRDFTTVNSANVWVDPAGFANMARSTSSARVKTAVRPWDRRHSVLDLTPSLFRSKAPADDGRRVRLSLIAEDVAELFPLAAVYDSEGQPTGIDWNPLIAGIIDELQHLKAS